MLTKRLELQSLWRNPKADSKAILEKEKEFRSLQNQMKDKAVQLKLEARTILTPSSYPNSDRGWGWSVGFGGGHMMAADMNGPGVEWVLVRGMALVMDATNP